MKMLSLPLVVLVLLSGLPAPIASATPSPQVTRLQAKVKTLRRELRQARAAVAGRLPAEVEAVALSGSASTLLRTVFEPLRANWPCGSSIYQGQTFWSVDVQLEEERYDEPDLLCNS